MVKAKITDEIAMPASKQKLQIGVSCGCTEKLLQACSQSCKQAETLVRNKPVCNVGR